MRSCLLKRPGTRKPAMAMDTCPTKLDYFDDLLKLHSEATVLSFSQGEDGRYAVALDSTIFHPQGGGQPSDTGVISMSCSDLKFLVEDVRSRDGTVFHYGSIENSDGKSKARFEKGNGVFLHVDESRRRLNSRLHSAGHLLDVCVKNVGLCSLEPVKGYHFPDGPFVEYKDTVKQNELQSKQKELEAEANELISRGGKVSATVLSYDELLRHVAVACRITSPREAVPALLR